MPVLIFHRHAYELLAVTLSSNEVLGILDWEYLEDYDGTDGQVSLHHLPSDQRFPILMTESPPESAPHEVFRGYASLAALPNGAYQIEGRVRDVAGNYTILSAFSAPRGDERIIPLAFEVLPGFGIIVDLGPFPLVAVTPVRLDRAEEDAVIYGMPGRDIQMPQPAGTRIDFGDDRASRDIRL